MEAVVVDGKLVHQLKGEIRLLPIDGHGIGFPEVLVFGGAAEHVRSAVVDGVPIGKGEFEVFPHCLAQDDFVRIVILEGERFLGLRTQIVDLFDF